MKVLIIEDYMQKYIEIKNLLELKKMEIVGYHSYLTGLKEMISNKYDLIILDMSLPNYDILSSEKSGKDRTYGGLDLLHEMRRRKITTKVIIITQFDIFGEIGEKKGLTQLIKEIEDCGFSNFMGLIYYDATSNDWEVELNKLLGEYIRND